MDFGVFSTVLLLSVIYSGILYGQHWVYTGKPDTHGLCLHGFLVCKEAHSIVIIAICVLREKKHYIGLYSKGN